MISCLSDVGEDEELKHVREDRDAELLLFLDLNLNLSPHLLLKLSLLD